MSVELTQRQKEWTRWGQLKLERASWMEHWSEISSYILPRNGRFFVQDRNKGQRRNRNIYDSTATRALRTLAAGLQGGATSPARPWMKLTVPDPELMKSQAVKVWLSECTDLMFRVFARSNTYRAFHHMYEELGAFGTGPSILVPDFRDVVRHYPLTAGEYCISTDWRGEVTTLYREFDKTVGEIVGEFGLDKCSTAVQNLYRRGSLESWITLIHCIEPRKDRDPQKIDKLNMPFRSVYFEKGQPDGKYLRESGFKQFPALTPRWALAGGDIYGHSPAMEALGDARQLQHEQLRKAQGIDYQTKPPLQVPMALKNMNVETLPGGISYYDPSTGPNGGIRTAFEVNLNLQHLLNDIQDVRQRINETFYVDLFRMLENLEGTNRTATEIAQRQEEKLILLGPTIERLHNEMLDPAVDLTFSAMVEANMLPPPPPELEGMPLNVEYTSVLAQAQRAIATNGIDRFTMNLGVIAQYKADVMDNFNADQWAIRYSEMLGVDPSLIVASDQVALIRENRAKMQQQAMAAEQARLASETAKNLGQTNLDGNTAAGSVAAMFSQ